MFPCVFLSPCCQNSHLCYFSHHEAASATYDFRFLFLKLRWPMSLLVPFFGAGVHFLITGPRARRCGKDNQTTGPLVNTCEHHSCSISCLELLHKTSSYTENIERSSMIPIVTINGIAFGFTNFENYVHGQLYNRKNIIVHHTMMNQVSIESTSPCT